MNILWIPHDPASGGVHRRDQYFMKSLGERHQIYSVKWETSSSGLKAYWDGWRFYQVALEQARAYHVRRIPDFLRPVRHKETTTLRINEYLFKRDIHEIVRRQDIDVVVAGPSRHMTGFPPFDLDVPLVFDYLDCAEWDGRNEWEEQEREYLESSDAVICVSYLALERAAEYGKPARRIPNGADVRRMRSATGINVRRRYGLEDAKIVSLIGLTCSERLYFLEAVERAREVEPTLRCLLVGDSPIIRDRVEQIPSWRDTFIYAGPVSYTEIAEYFAATDVGMYPVDETPYFHGASPIKIFEYSAAGKPVVVPRVSEVEKLGFPNIIFAAPDAAAYAEGILKALNTESLPVPHVERYDWTCLASQLEDFLTELVRDRAPARFGTVQAT